MSFLESIKDKKIKLNPTRTKVTSPSGRVTLENKGQIQILTESRPGFVVDLKPDLQVAQILPYLFLGSQDPAFDENILKSNNINHVLSLGIQVPNFDDINYYNLSILDLPEFDILPFLNRTIDIVEKVRTLRERIYVHCNAGVSRSPTFVIGYLMKLNNWNYTTAYDYLKEIRPCIKPNEGFKLQLIKFGFLNKIND